MLKVKLMAVLGLFYVVFNVYAAQPKFTIVPTVPNQNIIKISNGATANVVYRVTNKTKITRTLTWNAIPGVSQLINAASCPRPFTLAPNQSCLLSLQINGSEVPISGHIGGPVICKTNDRGGPDPFLCSEPSRSDLLSITKNSGFEFRQNGASIPRNTITLGSSERGTIELFNSGAETIRNIIITNNAPPLYLTSNCGATLAPNTGCNISYNIPQTPATGTFSLVARGTNANNSPATLTVNIVQTFAYVTNLNNNTVSICSIESDGKFSACAPTAPVFNGPMGIALNRALQKAYIANGDSVTVCDINPATGALSACNTVNLSSVSVAIEGIGLNPAGTRAYLTNSDGSITQCAINPNGSITGSNCSNYAVGVSSAIGIAINNSDTIAYITDNCCDKAFECPILPGGVIGTCLDSGNTFDIPDGIVLNNVNNLSYIANQAPDSISICPIINGKFGICTRFGDPLLQNPTGITLNASGSRVYIAEIVGNVIVCNVTNSGGLQGCQEAGNGFNQPFGIALTH